jgi:hypothetical protein
MNFVTTPRGDFMGTREAQITPQTEDRDICLELPQGSYSLGRLRHGEYGDGQSPQRDVTMLRGVRSPAALQAVP